MADKSARASVTIQCPNMVENSARDPRENFTTAKRMTAQVRKEFENILLACEQEGFVAGEEY